MRIRKWLLWCAVMYSIPPVGAATKPEISITPQDVIEFINQAMDMFPNNDTMQAVTGRTTCDNNNGQIIDWRVGPSSSGSSAGKVQLRWSWLCLVGTLAVGLSFQRSL